MSNPFLLLRRTGIFVIKILLWSAVWIALSLLVILGISLFHINEDEIILNGYETLILITVPSLLCFLLGQYLKKVKIRNRNIVKNCDSAKIQSSDIQDIDKERLVLSEYSSLPRFYSIDGVSYDLDVPASIKKIPVFFNTFEIEGRPYRMDKLLLEHARECVNEEIRNAAYEKAEEFTSSRIANECKCVSKQQKKDTSSCLTTINQTVNEVRESEKSLETIDCMDGYEFERWCAALLSRHGYTKVSLTKETGDQGVDILAEREGIRYAIQCKCYSRDLGNTPVQEVNAGKTFYNCQIGVVMTNRYFTKGAKDLAQSTGILLWDRDWLSTHNCPANVRRSGDLSQMTYDGFQHDELLWDAWSIISETRMATVTLLERRLRIGYARASRIIDELEDMGYIGPFRGSKPRDILK